MKKVLYFLILASHLVCTSAIAQSADTRSGNFWYSECDPNRSSAERISCFSYILGFTDGAFIQASLSNTEEKICRPKDATIAQMADIFYAFMRERPSMRHQKASLLLMAAMTDAFPCPGQGRSSQKTGK